MSVALPDTPMPSSFKVRPFRAGKDLTSDFDASITRVNRLGDKFRIEFSLPPLPRELADEWVADLLNSYGSTARMKIPGPPGGVGAPGAPQVNGASQAGMSLITDGFAAGYVMRKGQFYSILTGGKHYLHKMLSQVIANGAGQATLNSWPMMRVSPADNSSLFVAQPVIEGLIGGDDGSWDVDVAQIVGLSFTITEN